MKLKQQKTTQINDEASAVVSGIGRDLKNSVLIVSVITNLVFLTVWIALLVTSKYNVQLANLLFNN